MRIFNDDIGMEFRLDKYATIKMKRGKLVEMERVTPAEGNRRLSLLLFLSVYAGFVFLRTQVIGIIAITNIRGDRLSPWKIPHLIRTYPSCFPSYSNLVFHLCILSNINFFMSAILIIPINSSIHECGTMSYAFL